MQRRCRIDLISEVSSRISITKDNNCAIQLDVDPDIDFGIVDLPNIDEDFFSIWQVKCLTGDVSIGRVQFNHAWTMNEDFQKNCHDLYARIMNNHFDISWANSDELNLLKHYGMFRSCGQDSFAGWLEYRFDVKIDGTSVQLLDLPHKAKNFYSIKAGQILSFALSIPKPACLI